MLTGAALVEQVAKGTSLKKVGKMVRTPAPTRTENATTVLQSALYKETVCGKEEAASTNQPAVNLPIVGDCRCLMILGTYKG